MKSKTKFDPKVIQQFFIDHTEKIVVGLVAALFLFFAYQSVMLTGYAGKPEELKQKTDDALAKIAKGPNTKTVGDKKPTDVANYLNYADIIDGAKKIIDPVAYPMPPRLSWKPIAPRRVRDAPEVFAVEQLRAIPGRGALPAVEGKVGTIGKHWIVVTGLVPYKKQLAEYRAKFEGAAWNDPHEDKPNYVGYFVQRAELVPAATGEPKWSKFMVFPLGANEAAKIGGRTEAEIADPRFVLPSLTAPLPLLKDATWGNEVVFPPQIPMVERGADKDEGTVTAGEPTHRPGPGVPVAPGPVGPGHRQPGTGHNVPPAGVPGINAGGEGLLGETDVPKPKTEQAAPKDEEAQIPDYLLLRFFDLDVNPNKQYQYRIFLVLRNPNYRLDAMWLEEQELAISKWIGVKDTKLIKDKGGEIINPTDPRYAKWSSSCTSGRMSSDMRLLGGPVVAAKGTQEISAEVRVLIWQEDSGLNGSFHKSGLIRGTVLNFPGAAVKAPGVTRATQVDLTPNCILVDLQGGDPLPAPRDRPIVSPGVILVMDESGNLVMHDEVAETQEWDKAVKEPERQPPPDTRPKPRKQGEMKTPDDPDETKVEGLETGHTRPPGRRGVNP
ncbi:MAG: hypothetical protein WCJ35_11350 [Planctomycetota bacterium]